MKNEKGHLNYNKKLGADEWGMEWVDTTAWEAFRFTWHQMLAGDTSDGILGIPQIGKIKADKILNQSEEDGINLPETVLREYIGKFEMSQGIYEFQKNYRLLHLLDCDEDYLREVGYIPELPTFREVTKQENIEIKNEF